VGPDLQAVRLATDVRREEIPMNDPVLILTTVGVVIGVIATAAAIAAAVFRLPRHWEAAA
jgi:hypothetical protein